MNKYIEEYLEHKKTHVTIGTLKQYRNHLNHLDGIGKAITEITNADITEHRKTLEERFKTSTLSLYVHTIRGFFTYWSKRIDIKVFPDEIQRPYILEEPCRYLTVDELDRIEQTFNPEEFWSLRKLLMFKLLRDTGARVSEITSLPLAAIQNRHTQVVSKKSRKMRLLSWGEETETLLRKYLGVKICLNQDPWLFSEEGKALTTRSVQRWLKIAAEYAGVEGKVHPHLYRHTKAFETAQKMGLFAAQQKLGHTNVQSTLKYLRLDINHFLETVGEK